MPGKIRFGMVGTGFIADWVLAGARQDARFEAVAICSRTQERADAFAAKHGIPHTFTLLEEMAASPLVDAVYIATPNFLHASQSILCMRHGKHVLCEKPMAVTLAECESMVAAAEFNNRHLMIGHNMRFDPVHRRAKELLEQGVIGDVITFRTGLGTPGRRAGPWRATGSSTRKRPLWALCRIWVFTRSI
mgnify:CR=1 FL=1